MGKKGVTSTNKTFLLDNDSKLVIGGNETVSIVYECGIGSCGNTSAPIAPMQPLTLVKGNNKIGDLSISVTIQGPRVDGIHLESMDQLDIHSASASWTANSVISDTGARLVFFPEVLPTSNVTLKFSQLVANSVTLANGTIVVFRFPREFQPVHGTNFTVAIIAAKKLETEPSALQLRYSFPADEAVVFRLDAAATWQIESGDTQLLLSTIEFVDVNQQPSQTTQFNQTEFVSVSTSGSISNIPAASSDTTGSLSLSPTDSASASHSKLSWSPVWLGLFLFCSHWCY